MKEKGKTETRIWVLAINKTRSKVKFQWPWHLVLPHCLQISTRSPQVFLPQEKFQCPALPRPCLAHHPRAVEKGWRTNKSLSCFCGAGPTGLAEKAFLALKATFWVVFLQNPEPISVLTDCSIIPENYINHGPKIDLLFLYFFSLPSFPTSSHLLLDAWVDLD